MAERVRKRSIDMPLFVQLRIKKQLLDMVRVANTDSKGEGKFD
jgi:hypothetical protein